MIRQETPYRGGLKTRPPFHTRTLCTSDEHHRPPQTFIILKEVIAN